MTQESRGFGLISYHTAMLKTKAIYDGRIMVSQLGSRSSRGRNSSFAVCQGLLPQFLWQRIVVDDDTDQSFLVSSNSLKLPEAKRGVYYKANERSCVQEFSQTAGMPETQKRWL